MHANTARISSKPGSIAPKLEGKSSFAADVLKVATGTTAAQILSSISAPIIARLFAPDAFGVAALFGSLLGIAGIVACLRFENSILLPELDSDAAQAVALSLGVAASISALAVPLFWLGERQILAWLKAPALVESFWLLPIAIASYGATLVFTNWCTRKKRFSGITLAQFSMTLIATVFQLVAGLTGHLSSRVLVFSVVLGSVCNSLYLGILAWKSGLGRLVPFIRIASIRAAMTRYSSFAKLGTLSTILNVISWQLPAFLLAAFFSTGVVGQFSLGNRLLRVPMNLIGISIGRVFLQRAAEANQQGTLHVSVESAFHYLVALSMFPSLMLGLVGRDVFVVLLGAKWADAGLYAQILSPWVCVWFVSSPLSVIFTVTEKLALDLRVQVLIFTTRLGSLVAGGVLHSVELALALFSITGVLTYGYYCILAIRVSGAKVKGLLPVFGSNLLEFVPSGLLILALKASHTSRFVVLIAAALLTAVHYGRLARRDPQARRLFSLIGARFAPGTPCTRNQS